MMHTPEHYSDDQLLLLADGELNPRAATRSHAHLAECPECTARMHRIQSTLLAATAAATAAAAQQQNSRESVMDAAGPRALLQARLTELAHTSQTRPRFPFRYTGSLAYACALALLVLSGAAFLRHHRAAAGLSAYARMLPDPEFTPGSTRNVALTDLCAADHDDVVRDVSRPLQQKVLQEYGMRDVPASDFEVDYLITPGLGGSEDVRNLWPEPHSNTAWNSYVKDQLEDHLHRMVCERKISLGEAQKEIASNWIAAYKKYFHTEQPLGNPSLGASLSASLDVSELHPTTEPQLLSALVTVGSFTSGR